MKLTVLLALLCTHSFVRAFFFNTAKGGVQSLKQQILELSRQTKRGLTETPDDRTKMLNLFEQLGDDLCL